MHPKKIDQALMLYSYVRRKANNRIFLEGFLGVLSAFGPFVMDMYISAFPQIMSFYQSVPSVVQLSLTTCTIGLALGQLLFGTVSDRFGRRLPLLLSLGIYLVATLGCIVSPSIWLFVAMRFFQGLAAAGAVVISRSIAADCYSGSELARMYGIIGMINGVSTVLAPVFGGLVIEAFDWKAVFVALFGIGIVMSMGGVVMQESLPVANRISLKPTAFLDDIKRIVVNKVYVNATVQYGLVMAIIFVNLASCPFIMSNYGLSAEQTSIVFGINSIALAISSGVASRFKEMRVVMRYASAGMVAASLLLACSLVLGVGFWAYEGSLFMLYLFVGAVCTGSTTVAMDAERENAGIASAFFGAMGYLGGGIASPLVGVGNIFISSSVIFVVLTVLSLALSLMAEKSKAPQAM